MCENTDSRCTTTLCKPRDPLSTSGLSRFLLPTFLCSGQRKVGAAPHRGNANRPLAIQGKAKALRTQTNKRRAGKKGQLDTTSSTTRSRNLPRGLSALNLQQSRQRNAILGSSNLSKNRNGNLRRRPAANINPNRPMQPGQLGIAQI